MGCMVNTKLNSMSGPVANKVMRTLSLGRERGEHDSPMVSTVTDGIRGIVTSLLFLRGS